MADEDLVAEKRRLQRRIAMLERRVAMYSARNENLQQYLDLFLNHPVYRVYRFFKRLFRGTFSSSASPARVNLEYQGFQILNEPAVEDLKQQVREISRWQEKPLLEIVTAVYQPPLSVFRQTAESVLHQTYDRWIWQVVDASEDETVWKYLCNLASKDSRIHMERLSENKGISNNINSALKKTTGDYIVMLDHDDTIASHALYCVAEMIRKHPDADFLYSDADKLDEHGRRCDPLFKPDWSPELLLCCNLLNQLSVFRRTWLDRIGYLKPELDGAQDWDFYLRITEQTDHVYHIPGILHHWRKSERSTAQATENKPYVRKAQSVAITAHLERTGLVNPIVHFDETHSIHRTHPLIYWTPSKRRKISIIIPSLDQLEVMSRCITSLFSLTNYENFEVILVDTGSTDPEVRLFYEKTGKDPRFRCVQFSETFNFSKACNFGASSASGDLFLFLNNDTEILQKDWLQLMSQWFDRKGIGIVGPKLLYPTGEIQHAGVILGLGGLASHIFLEMRENGDTIFGSDGWYRNLSAVTGACLMISRDLFETVGRFDEEYRLNYSDVDLCLRVRQAGYRILYTPHVRLLHHEAVTHERLIPRSDFERACRKWLPQLKQGDPYYNPNLSYRHAIPQIRLNAEDTAEQVTLHLMQNLPQKEMISLPEDVMEADAPENSETPGRKRNGKDLILR